MDWQDIINAVALLLIFEGLLPFTNPASVKKLYRSITETPESSLRLFGLASIVVGLALLYLS